MAEKDIAVDISAPKPQSMSESHLVRKMHKPACFYCCCQKRTYKFVSPDGAEHNAAWEETPCLERCCGWICCRGYFSTIRFGSASGPDFESKKTINCCRFHVCSRFCGPCGLVAGACCAVLGRPCVGDDSCDRVFPCCRTLCKSHKVVDAKGGAGYGDIREATCWSSCCQLCFPCKAYPIYTSYDASGAEKYVLRDSSMMVIHKLPVTAPDSQSPIAWITVTAQKAACCNGCMCCYCGHRKSASLEVDHAHGLSFQERAHLMSLAMKYDEGLFVEAVGCCYNDP